jgi:ribonucleoside-diphosphate reductase alpha chain
MARERLPDTRASVTHKAVIRWGEERVKFYITVGLYEEDDQRPEGQRPARVGTEGGKRRPGEVFLTFDEAGSMLDGWADAWSTAISLCLQHGETLENLVAKFGYQRFDPQGMTENDGMPFVSSVVDYVARWMKMEFEGDGNNGRDGTHEGD